MKASPLLYYVTDPNQTFEFNVDSALAAAQSGAAYVQLRCKSSPRQTILKLAREITRAIEPYNTQFIMNDFLDIAMAVDSDGVHLGQSDGSVIGARRLLGPHKIIGLTVDSWPELEAAQALPIDYIGLSSLFPSATKSNIKHFWGWEGLKRAVSFSATPLVPIGGITMSDIPSLAQMPLHAIAVTSVISSAASPAFTAKSVIRLLNGAS